MGVWSFCATTARPVKVKPFLLSFLLLRFTAHPCIPKTKKSRNLLQWFSGVDKGTLSSRCLYFVRVKLFVKRNLNPLNSFEALNLQEVIISMHYDSGKRLVVISFIFMVPTYKTRLPLCHAIHSNTLVSGNTVESISTIEDLS